MAYEVRTPALVEAMSFARLAAQGITERSLPAREAGQLIAAANSINKAVGTDIKARLALPRIMAEEAKIMAGSRRPTKKRIPNNG